MNKLLKTRSKGCAFWTTSFQLFRNMIVFGKSVSVGMWLTWRKQKTIYLMRFLRKLSDFLLKQKQWRITLLHYTSQSILPVHFLRLHACFSSFLSFGCFQEVNDGEKLAGNNNNFTWRIRGFTLRRGIRCRWFGRRCRHWFVYHIQHINAFETT